MSSRPSASLSNISRRSWTALLAASVPLFAQAPAGPPPQGSPKPPAVPATPEARVQKAISDVRSASDRLAQIEVAMDLEPAFSFRP